jgi:hypothetical protein
MSVTPGSADYENQQVRTPNRVSGTRTLLPMARLQFLEWTGES